MTEAEKIQLVWNKGAIPIPQEAANWRKDTCGAWIARNQYGNRDSNYGWEIDHINPNGGDAISNLQPLQWENNVAKSDGRHKCVVKGVGNKNFRQPEVTISR
ncbi:MAG TPA: HNH endonuclease signature motif containing protein [Prosthecobacter sp.]|nr:HNH endonuclease signature motif containing protein [Prosthecobacter sp.]HRK13548.1 HNH endonuclease signature motif containing protein [Prosthecobacter sp.]